ncbi:MAG: radical SAM protein [Deltaproteobacteria bacterium]|nr:radical SAM protein [Deltaproteobacteria bacterium]MBW2067679.1 radical SAM protein [Deltaproteobacteria bacterium]
MKRPFVLLINPWITDFAAHDLWARPLGLLFIASLLRQGGVDVAFIDCLERGQNDSDSVTIPGKVGPFGTGKYDKTPINKPPAYSGFPRRYFRYGIPTKTFQKKLESLPRVPDLILMTCVMTYWYPGVQQAINITRKVLPNIPIWLGGIYAKLCKEHAIMHSGADRTVTEPLEKMPELFSTQLCFSLKNPDQWQFSRMPIPAWDLVPDRPYRVLAISQGCPFRCAYCASPILQPQAALRPVDKVYQEILDGVEKGIKDFAFYDDALLMTAWPILKSLLQHIVSDGIKVRFHTPNALHARAITPSKAELLSKAGFTTIRLGLETASFRHQLEWGNKVNNRQFIRAVRALKDAGIDAPNIGVYLLCGVPGQTPEEVTRSIDFVTETGVLPFIAEYSPIPKTLLWQKAVKTSRFPIADDPLYHNNSFFACRSELFSYEDMLRVKNYARAMRGFLVKTSMANSRESDSSTE